MPKTDLREILLRHEAELSSRQMPRAMDLRLRERLRARAEQPTWRKPLAWRLGAMAAVATAAGLALWVWTAQPTATRLGDFVLASASADLRIVQLADGAIELTAGQGTLIDDLESETLAVVAPARLRKEQQGLRVLAGTVAVKVKKRPPASAPARILVSHGAIEVLGTHFTVVQSPVGGSVTLHEGTIRFRDLADAVRAVAVGQTLRWPLLAEASATEAAPQPPAPGTAAAEPPARPSPLTSSPPTALPPAPLRRSVRSAPVRHGGGAPLAPSIDPGEVIRQVEELRSRGRFREAVQRLAQGLEEELAPQTRERFSYEIGSILTYQLAQHREACSHWEVHLARYPGGRYSRDVLQAMAEAQCAGSGR